MKTIVVDDEAIMLRSFLRQSKDIRALEVIGTFQDAESAEEFARKNRVDLAILDIKLPRITGLELAQRLRAMRPDILIVFISAYDEYIRQSNEIDADYYILKPYNSEILANMADKMQILSQRQRKELFVQMFGRFTVYRNNIPLALTGKAKEILALVATRRGKEISNEEIYTTIWEGRKYSNNDMKVYYNALQRLKNALKEQGISELLQSTSRGQIFNTAMADCDYYNWQDKDMKEQDRFEGEFLSEYSWGEFILADIMNREHPAG